MAPGGMCLLSRWAGETLTCKLWVWLAMAAVDRDGFDLVLASIGMASDYIVRLWVLLVDYMVDVGYDGFG